MVRPAAATTSRTSMDSKGVAGGFATQASSPACSIRTRAASRRPGREPLPLSADFSKSACLSEIGAAIHARAGISTPKFGQAPG